MLRITIGCGGYFQVARSKLREDQFRDEDVLTEDEHSNTQHYFSDLEDTPATFSGFGGKTLRVKNDGTAVEFEEWSDLYPKVYIPPTGSGIGFDFTGGYTEPDYNEVDFIFDVVYNIASGDCVFVNSTDKEFAVILPLTPTIGDRVSFIDGGGYSSTNNITISGAGKKIMGSYDNYIIDTNFSSFDLLYYNELNGWITK